MAILHIICETSGCSNNGQRVNSLFGEEFELLDTLEQWESAHEDSDICQECGKLGVAQELN